MLLTSPRHTAADLAHWRIFVKTIRPNNERDDGLISRAVETLRAHRAGGLFVTSTSWGRDSVVLAHLLALSDVDSTLTYAITTRRDSIPNPDSPLVRDAFLARFPLPYAEYRGDAEDLLAEMTAVHGGRYASGVRADESLARARSTIHGQRTERVARPLIYWSSLDVWRHLLRHDLPIHPAYACTNGGGLRPDWIRVHSIGDREGRANGRWEWEDAYYPEGRHLRREWA